MMAPSQDEIAAMLPASVLVLAALLAIAAWRDVLIRTIPDWIALAIAGISLGVRSTLGWTPLLHSAAVAALLFAFLLFLAIRGWLGGGDVKLAAALALGLPPAVTWDFMAATVLVGGVLGCFYLFGRRFTPHLRLAGRMHPVTRILTIEARRLRRGGPLPYGVAIAAGGIFVLLAGY